MTKFLVYNARKRQEGGDRPDAYFSRTECVAGVPKKLSLCDTQRLQRLLHKTFTA